MSDSPIVIVFAGINGAGKSTSASALLPLYLGLNEFVNADTIARGLSAYNPESVAVTAGRIMLERLDELARQRANFAFETTLSGRSYAKRLAELRQSGYHVHLYYFWLPNAELAVERVHRRVKSGGHSVPDDTVRRRYRASVGNFFRLYRPLANRWRFLDNRDGPAPRVVAEGTETSTRVFDSVCWENILQSLTMTPKKSLHELLADGHAIDRAFRFGAQRALWEHKQLGQSVAVWRDGKVVILSPEEIDVEKPVWTNGHVEPQ